jgi:hypothetical protein
MLQTIPLSTIRRWNWSLVYWAILIGVMQQGIRLAALPDRYLLLHFDGALVMRVVERFRAAVIF